MNKMLQESQFVYVTVVFCLLYIWTALLLRLNCLLNSSVVVGSTPVCSAELLKAIF